MRKGFELLKIEDENGHIYYGGDQSWYASNTRAMAGCSSVATANSLRSLLRINRESFEIVRASHRIPSPVKHALISRKCLKNDYVLLMTAVYNTMGAFEIFPLNKIYDHKDRDNKIFKFLKPNSGRSSIGFIQGTLMYARKLGLYLSCRALPTAFVQFSDAFDFIKQGLSESGSVVILTSYNKHSIKTQTGIYTMKCHFATITDVSDKEVTISTWGKIATIDFDELVKSWQSIKAFESTLFYFTPSDKKDMLHSFLNSPVPFFKGILQAIIRKAVP